MANSADHDQSASSEANWSGSALFAPGKDRVYPCSAGQELTWREWPRRLTMMRQIWNHLHTYSFMKLTYHTDVNGPNGFVFIIMCSIMKLVKWCEWPSLIETWNHHHTRLWKCFYILMRALVISQWCWLEHESSLYMLICEVYIAH